MKPALGQNPVAGARIAPGFLTISFGLTSGDLRLSVGTTAGDSDVHTEVVTLPAGVSFTAPSVEALYLAAWYESGGSFQTYTWQYAVGDGAEAQALGMRRVVVGHLLAKWKRSELAAGAIEVEDAAHGQDEISPVAFIGEPFDANVAEDVAPFIVEQVNNADNGTGYLILQLRPIGEAIVAEPGCPANYEEQVELNAFIYTPSKAGSATAYLYGSLLAQIYGRAFLRYDAGKYIANVKPSNVTPEWLGDDGTWTAWQWSIMFKHIFRGGVPTAGE